MSGLIDAGGFPDGFREDIHGDGFDVTFRRVGAVAVIRFAAPPQNHFSVPLLQALATALEFADADPSIRASVLSSEGKNFCAGADLVSTRQEPRRLYVEAARLFAARKPIVAAVQGAAIGGGLGLALVADFRVVSPASRLAANFVKIGIHPGFGMTLVLPRLIGHQAASDLLQTGRRLTGEEAVEMRLADRLAPDGGEEQAAIRLASEIAGNAPLAVEATRATLRAQLVDDIRRQTELEAIEQERLRETADFAEGVRAVAERRPGVWQRR